MALSTTFTQCAQETIKFGKMTQNKSHFAVQGHSRSPILIPIENLYNFILVINTDLPPILHCFGDTAFESLLKNCSRCQDNSLCNLRDKHTSNADEKCLCIFGLYCAIQILFYYIVIITRIVVSGSSEISQWEKLGKAVAIWHDIGILPPTRCSTRQE